MGCSGAEHLSKRKKQRSKKVKSGKVTKLPARQVTASGGNQDRKLSEIIKEMAMRLLKNPEAIPSKPAAVAALILAGAAWNSAIGDTVLRDQHRKLVEQIDWNGVKPWAELRSDDTDKLIAELVEHKKDRYPHDNGHIIIDFDLRMLDSRLHDPNDIQTYYQHRPRRLPAARRAHH